MLSKRGVKRPTTKGPDLLEETSKIVMFDLILVNLGRELLFAGIDIIEEYWNRFDTMQTPNGEPPSAAALTPEDVSWRF